MKNYTLEKKRRVYFAFLQEGSVEHATKAYDFLYGDIDLMDSLNVGDIFDSYYNLRYYGKLTHFDLIFLVDILMDELKINKNFNSVSNLLQNYYNQECARPREDSNLRPHD
jgi:hypothetical protein